MRVLSQSLVWVVGVWPHDIFGRMTFLDLTEGAALLHPSHFSMAALLYPSHFSMAALLRRHVAQHVCGVGVREQSSRVRFSAVLLALLTSKSSWQYVS